ncbi:2-hexaprenyl-6-methoxy-1,4-benzoquinone methyltransferase [Apophysomyces ossiformis]|uniref:2-methoxy-6-polyprenyl-1,4-benzoquinol methylase, mitochondrial n=1 Tax=Apophysomyces ossiformis TaxID=679940 RepID=A0A8H7BX26_9FUNG|nr:2-hexaprenyl-6-methoxy-1,4-benzoquinone methyltransferase [Apophysomyces ossiformis]
MGNLLESCGQHPTNIYRTQAMSRVLLAHRRVLQHTPIISYARRSIFSTPQRFEKKDSEPKLTHFGFRDVAEEEKESLVHKVFANVATKYDVMNDAMSMGVHRVWKDQFIRNMAPGPGTKLLDVAGGDIALRFLDYCRNIHHDSTAEVTMVDINPHMLEEGKKRFQTSPYANTNQARFLVQNAEHLDDIPDESVDVYTIAFGIRNCTHVDKVVKEAYRVLKPGGRFMCLEFSRVDNPVIGKLYDIYSFDIIPALGQIIANDRDSYQYLVESIRKFPPQEEFAQMISDAGFATVGKGYEDLTFGVASIHSGYKI